MATPLLLRQRWMLLPPCSHTVSRTSWISETCKHRRESRYPPADKASDSNNNNNKPGIADPMPASSAPAGPLPPGAAPLPPGAVSAPAFCPGQQGCNISLPMATRLLTAVQRMLTMAMCLKPARRMGNARQTAAIHDTTPCSSSPIYTGTPYRAVLNMRRSAKQLVALCISAKSHPSVSLCPLTQVTLIPPCRRWLPQNRMLYRLLTSRVETLSTL
ncbi:hypothetical protein V8C26DRAFT_1023 [Trichoderma gracile]